MRPAHRHGSTRKASPEDARQTNRALLLDLLRREGPLSRADLARITGLTPATVGNVARELLADDLIEDRGTQSGSVGKPARLLGIHAAGRTIVGIDLSDPDEVRGVRTDLAGQVLGRHQQPRQGATGPAAVEAVIAFARELVEACEHPLLGVGIGTPGLVDEAGIVRDAANLGWTKVDLAMELSSALGAPVLIDNDANAAAVAELAFGPATSDLILLRVGKGLGAGIVLDGVIRRGARSGAGEIGHVVVDPGGAPCPCGRVGCLETVLSVPALRARLDGLDGQRARAVIEEAGATLGATLAVVASALDVHDIAIAGPPLLDRTFLEATAAALTSRLLPALADQVEVRSSHVGEDAVALGAAALVRNRQLGLG